MPPAWSKRNSETNVKAEFKEYNKERDLNFTYYMKGAAIVTFCFFDAIDCERILQRGSECEYDV